MNKQPSYVGIDEKAGTFTIAYLPSWYHEDSCNGCRRHNHLISPWNKTEIGFCDLIENEEPCEKTGIGPEGEK